MVRHARCRTFSSVSLVSASEGSHHEHEENSSVPGGYFAGGGVYAAVEAWGQAPGEDRAFGVPAKKEVRREQSNLPAPAAGMLTDRPDDEKAIRQLSDAFAQAFAKGDAKAIAAMYDEDAELI